MCRGLSNAVGKVKSVASSSFFDKSVSLRVSAASFGKHCISSAVISVTVCFVIATGSACSLDLAGRFNLLYSSKLDENAGSLCFGGGFHDDMAFLLKVTSKLCYLSKLFSFQLHACYAG